jgi:hypothetical protein
MGMAPKMWSSGDSLWRDNLTDCLENSWWQISSHKSKHSDILGAVQFFPVQILFPYGMVEFPFLVGWLPVFADLISILIDGI